MEKYYIMHKFLMRHRYVSLRLRNGLLFLLQFFIVFQFIFFSLLNYFSIFLIIFIVWLHMKQMDRVKERDCGKEKEKELVISRQRRGITLFLQEVCLIFKNKY